MAYNPWQFPGAPPAYTPVYNPATMDMTPTVEGRLAGLSYDTRGLDAFRQEALRKGASPWARMSSRRQFAEETDMRERARREGAGQAAQGRTMLAMRGGLSSGARERMGREAIRSGVGAGQDVARQGGMNRLAIGIQDEQNRIGNLSQLPGMEGAKFQSDLQKEQLWTASKNNDLMRLMTENQAKNQFGQNTYQQQMQAWAADRQAHATEEAGKK